jgi:hypothetical protein
MQKITTWVLVRGEIKCGRDPAKTKGKAEQYLRSRCRREERRKKNTQVKGGEMLVLLVLII